MPCVSALSSEGALAEAWFYVRVAAIMAPVIALLTAGVGYAMQVSIQARRQERLPHAA